VSAREELVALSGAADGGIILLLATESGPAAAPESLVFGVAVLLLLHDPKTNVKDAKEIMNNFFIKLISGIY